MKLHIYTNRPIKSRVVREVASLALASKVIRDMIDSGNLGSREADDMGITCNKITDGDDDSVLVGFVSYNGRVWPGSKYVPGCRPLYEPAGWRLPKLISDHMAELGRSIIAERENTIDPLDQRQVWSAAIHRLAEALGEADSLFDKARFLVACGYDPDGHDDTTARPCARD